METFEYFDIDAFNWNVNIYYFFIFRNILSIRQILIKVGKIRDTELVYFFYKISSNKKENDKNNDKNRI